MILSGWTNLSDISGISQCTNVTYLNLSGCHVVNLRAIKNYNSLETLDLTNNALDIDIYDDEIKDTVDNVGILVALNKKNLSKIYLLGNNFRDTSGLQPLKSSVTTPNSIP